jgi:hypothetical protein
MAGYMSSTNPGRRRKGALAGEMRPVNRLSYYRYRFFFRRPLTSDSSPDTRRSVASDLCPLTSAPPPNTRH